MSTDKQRKANKAKLHEQRWHFSGIDDSELVAATYYEYACESKTIVEGLREKPDASTPTIMRGSPVGVGLPVGGTPLSVRFTVAFREKIRQQAYPLWVTLTPKPLPGSSADKPPSVHPCVKPWEPWQEIAEETRRAICEELALCVSKEIGPVFLPFNRCSDLRDLGLVDASDNYRWAEIDPELRIERLRVQIDWNFTNDQIREAFKLWLKENRPLSFPEPSDKGHKPVDWRARLERLGLLRLRSRYTFNKAEPFLKQLYPQKQSTQSQPPRKYSDKGECNREAKKAIDDFHALFPFLDPAEKPLSWPMK